MFRAAILVLLLTASPKLNAIEGSYASKNLEALRQSQGSGSVPSESQQTEKSGQGAPPVDTPKPVLADGTAVRLKFVGAVVSSQVLAGEKVPLEVIEPVLVGSLIAISRHAQAEAIVTMAQPKGGMGRSGNLQLKIETVRLADGEIVPVRAVKDVKVGDRKAVAIAAWTVWPFPLKGKDATIAAGTEITAYISGDFGLDPSKFQAPATNAQEKNGPK